MIQRSIIVRWSVSALCTLTLSMGTVMWQPPIVRSSTASITTPNGIVGLNQQVVVRAPKALIGKTVALLFTSSASSTTLETVINPQGFGVITWTPAQAGRWAITGLNNATALGATAIDVAPMPTITTLFVPNFVQQDVASQIVVRVSAPLGTVPPAGVVTVRAASSQRVMGQATVSGIPNSAHAVANVTWVPPQSGDLPLIATFTPSNSAFTSSVSLISQPQVTTSLPMVGLRFAPVISVGQETAIDAILGEGIPDGSVAFLLDDVGITASMPTKDGVGGFRWTPTRVGVQTITVQFSGPRNISSPSSQQVNVLPRKPSDGISTRSPDRADYSSSTPIVMLAGSTTSLQAGSTSGSPVVLGVSGPCVLNGSQLQALAQGTCTLRATSPGSANYLPNSTEYTITVQASPRRPRR